MALEHDKAMATRLPDWRFRYDERELMLYHLGIGMGSDPRELPFLYEGLGPRAVPTVATVLGGGSGIKRLVGVDLDWTRVLHGEQRLTLHRSIPPSGELTGSAEIIEIVDKGAAKGATLTLQAETRLASGEPLYTSQSTIFARGDGGGGGTATSRSAPHRIPDRAPDLNHVTRPRPDQALLYRLSGDRNPLHADPAFAAAAGFPRPILHGLCSYGIACRAVLASLCDYDERRIAEFDVRFTSPVFPGETILTEMWIEGDIASFRCRVEERGVISIDNGRCRMTAPVEA